ncbi:MAG TPA: GNAT family N-acetyltransferase [Streptomyces sp.]
MVEHLRWAAGELGVVHRFGGASAVVAAGLSGRDRIAVEGDADDAVVLVGRLLAEFGPTYRPFGEAELVRRLVRGVPQLSPGGPEFLWMETSVPPGAPEGVEWLDAAGERAAGELFREWFPSSHAQPGRAGVGRWAGVRDGDRVSAVAADAWSAEGCGFLAGVVTRPDARGRGLGAAVSAYVVDFLVRRYGCAALMVDADNPAAVSAYERVGMSRYVFGVAAVAP